MFTSKRARRSARPQGKRRKSLLVISVSRNTSKVLNRRAIGEGPCMFGVEVSVGTPRLLHMWKEQLGVVVPIELDPAGHAFRK